LGWFWGRGGMHLFEGKDNCKEGAADGIRVWRGKRIGCKVSGGGIVYLLERDFILIFL
jgi:hypothetical protein